MDSKPHNHLVIILERVLKEYKISVSKFAKEANIPQTKIYKWFSQGNNPKSEDERKAQEWLAKRVSEGLKDPEILAYLTNNNVEISPKVKEVDALQLVTHLGMRIEAMIKVMLRSQAEILAAQRDESVTKILSELTKAVNDECEGAFSSL